MARSFPLEEQLLTTNLPAEGGGGIPGGGVGSGHGGASDGSSLIGRLAKIRAKFKQVQGLLQAGSSYATMPGGMSASSSHHQHHPFHHQHRSSHQQQQTGHHQQQQTGHHQQQQTGHHQQQPTGHQHFQQQVPVPNLNQQWQQVPLTRTRSPVFRDSSFDSRTSGGPGGGIDASNEMSF